MKHSDETVSAIILLSILVIGFPFIVYCWKLYLDHRFEEYFVKRDNVIVSGIMCLITLSLLIDSPILICSEYDIGLKWNEYYDMFETFEFCLIVAIHCIYCLRYFIIYFQLSLHQTLSNQSWQTQICKYVYRMFVYTARIIY